MAKTMVVFDKHLDIIWIGEILLESDPSCGLALCHLFHLTFLGLTLPGFVLSSPSLGPLQKVQQNNKLYKNKNLALIPNDENLQN